MKNYNSRIRFILNKIHSKKKEKILLSWFLKKGSICFLKLVYLPIYILGKFLTYFKRNELTCYFGYDICPPSFDCIPLFAAAEIHRRKKKYRSIHLYCFCKPQTRRELFGKTVLDQEWYKWRFHNIVFSSITLFPNITSYSVTTSKWKSISHLFFKFHIFPFHPFSPFRKSYESIFRSSFPLLKKSTTSILHSPQAAKRYIQEWIDIHASEKKIITITLRVSPFSPRRNSKILEWAQFAKKYDNDEYHIVFIMDTDTVLHGYPEPLKNYTFFDAACWNLGIRSALYEMAYLNCFTSGGTYTLGAFNKGVRFLFFKVVVKGDNFASEEVAKKQGYIIGKNFPWATPYQKFVWEDDDFPVIEREFLAMCQKIENENTSKEVSQTSLV